MFKKFKRRPKETISYEFYFFSGSGHIRFSNFWMHGEGSSWRDCARSPNIFSREQRQVSNLQLPKLIWKICREGVNYKSVEAVLKLEKEELVTSLTPSCFVLFHSFPSLWILKYFVGVFSIMFGHFPPFLRHFFLPFNSWRLQICCLKCRYLFFTNAFWQPFTIKISLVIFLTTIHTILTQLVWRI